MAQDEFSERSGMVQRLFEARLAELGSARDELVSAISNQHLVLTFGTASIVGVLVAGFLTWESPANAAVFFAVPPISAWVLAMWLAEVVRMLRAVEFCREQERVINEAMEMDTFDFPPIRWERWRAEPGRTILWSYVSVVLVLSGAYLAGGLCGLIVVDWSCRWVDIAAAVLLVALGALLAVVHAVYRRWTKPNSRVGMPSSWRPNR